MKRIHIQPALLTRTEIKWLLGNVKVSKPYEYRIKRDIRKKIKTFTDLELPLLLKRRIIDLLDLSIFTQNLRISPQTKDQIIPQPSQDIENCAQNMVGRKGFEPSNPAMSRHFDSSFWQQYKTFLTNSVSADTASDRMSYAKK
jgi:hypothetical protein